MNKVKQLGLAVVAAVVTLASGIDAWATEKVALTPVDMGIDWSATIANIGAEYGTILVAAMALMVGVCIVSAGYMWVRRGTRG